MFMRMSLHPNNVNDVIYDAEGAREGQYGCTQGLIWFHVGADRGSRERAVMGVE